MLVLANVALAGPSVADAVAMGNCPSAMAALEAPPPAEEEQPSLETSARSLARAWCLLRGGTPEEALVALEQAAGLERHAALVRARALAALGRPDDALAALADVELPGAGGREVKLLRGQILAARGDARGERDLKALLGTGVEPQARFWLAEAAGVGGGVEQMLEGLRAVWVDARPGGWDAKAAARLAEHEAPVPDLDSPAGRALARKRLDRLHAHHRVSDALELARALQEKEPPSQRSDWVTTGSVHFAARDYAGALAAWRNALGPPAEATGSANELFDYALCHARAGDYDTAAIVYRRLVAAHPTSRKADFASFKLGYMEYDRGACDRALPLLDEHRQRYPDGHHLDEALWFSARCHWRAGERARAVEMLGELREQRPKSSLVPGAAYWQARALGLAGDEEGERRALQGVLDGWPTSGYAWFAAQRLHTTFAPRPVAEPPPWPAPLAGKGAVRRAEALLGVGLRAWALDELETLGAPGDAASGLPLAWAHLRAGDYRGAQKLACPHAPAPWRSGSDVAQQACVPRPERTIVEEQAERWGLDPAVAYSVMVAESALEPGVTSAAGARGLMQLMPEVGGRLHAEAFPGRPYDADDLYRGPYNAALGTMELGQRARSLAGVLVPSDAPAVVASYNGGEEAVRRWLGDGPPPPFDEWTEDIGYTETRGYVKRVLGNVMAYRWVYGDP